MTIKFEPIQQEDLSLVVGWINSEPEEYFLQWGGNGAGFKYPLDLLQIEQHFNSSLGETPIRRLYKAVKEEIMVGYIELNNINRDHNNAVVSRVLVNKKFEGQGIGYSMVKWLTDLAFREFGLHRISLGVFDFNIRGYRCYEKVGYINEGTLRDSMKVKHSYWSSILMSILKDEWTNKNAEKNY